MSSKHRAMICNGCKHYAKSHHYCCAEHKALPAIAVPVTCTAFAPRIAPNAKDDLAAASETPSQSPC